MCFILTNQQAFHNYVTFSLLTNFPWMKRISRVEWSVFAAEFGPYAVVWCWLFLSSTKLWFKWPKQSRQFDQYVSKCRL